MKLKTGIMFFILAFIAIECFTGECSFRSYQIISFNEKSFAIFLSWSSEAKTAMIEILNNSICLP